MISLDNLKTAINAIKCLLTDYPKKKDIPTKLPNPSPLTFTGVVTGSYDGSEALTVEIPPAGGGGGSTVELDTTLTQSGKAADAKAVGDALAGKQDTISDLEAIRTGAAKGATALQSVPSTYRTASEQDTIDDGKVDKVTGKGLSSNDYTDAAKAKVDALAPVATSGSYNDLTNKPTIPTALPNPNALTFTGAVTGSYDGSAPLTVNIPAGGGGTGGGSSGTWELIGEVTSDGAGTNTGISIPCDISGYKSVFVYAQNLPSDTNFRIVMRTTLTWSQYACFFGYNLLGKQNSFTFGAQDGKMNNPWSITGLAYNVANHIFSYGAAESIHNGGTAPWRQSEQSNKLPTENWANVKYISLDRNSSTDIVPEGCILRAWGCK